MKNLILPIALMSAVVLGGVATSAAKDSKKPAADPTVMTVNGKKVPLSEFEYLYNKNNSQQAQQLSVDDYADMFMVYKMKVADAEAAGVDTTAAFISEFTKYRDELAKPYMVDEAVNDSLVNETYNFMKTNRDVNYIMMFGGRTPQERAATKARLDSIRTAIVTGNGDFATLADQFSVDKNGGHMGFMTPNRYPYAFEKAVYYTPVGEVSEVQEFPFGFFIVRVDSERPDPGRIHARHILKLTRGLSDEQKLQKRAEIDSIHALLMAGADFADLAQRESEDPGSKANGGDLGMFGAGQMVKPFETAAFALADGQISNVVESPFGYHIIQRLEGGGIPPLSEVKNQILDNMNRDDRGKMAERKKLDGFKALYKARINDKTLANVKKAIDKADGIAPSLATDKKVVAEVADKKITVAEVAAAMNLRNDSSATAVYESFDATTRRLLDEATHEYAIAQLPARYPDYRNLINEYHDGMLLFEISNRNVWERASKDTEGLEAYYQSHRDNYKWDKPRYKGYVVFATSDSIGSLVKDYLADCTLPNSELSKELRNRFGNDVKIQQVLSGKGDNEIIDHLVFGGPEPSRPNKQWPVSFPYRGKVIDQPESAADVRGAVTADYQQELDSKWTDSLREKYPVEINRDVLKTVK